MRIYRNMRLRWIRPFVVLLACLITCIANIKMHKPITDALFLLLIVVIVFYIIGGFVTFIIQKTINMDGRDDKEEEQEDETTNDLQDEIENEHQNM